MGVTQLWWIQGQEVATVGQVFGHVGLVVEAVKKKKKIFKTLTLAN